jgi:16S rRNA (cytosine1402-N4)-methyltransferase
MDNNPAMHKPVMLDEVLHYLAPRDGETYIDATFGAGGYSTAILRAANCKVIGIDQDPLAADIASKVTGNFKFIAGNFGELSTLVTEQVDGIVFDIGVSSMQIDRPERGFSFSKNGPLDMRMSQSGISAADFLNDADEEEIANVIYKYGEEKNSRRIAKSIIANRPLTTTLQLAEAVHKVSKYDGKTDSATKTFQALRIFINSELEVLEQGLEAALKLLKAGGRLVVVTFHSLEDRIVKTFIKENSSPKEKINKYSSAMAEKKSESALEIITRKAIMPSENETRSNPRARSAKLRVAKKTEYKSGGNI